MIETKNMEDFVHEQIHSAVDHFVSSVITDDAWMQELEQRIVRHVQDRITARFANIETVPDLVSAVKTSVRDLMTQGHVPGIDRYVDNRVIAQTIDRAVEQQIGRSVDLLAADPAWVSKMETLINQNYMRRVAEWISTRDLDSMVVSLIDNSVDRWQDRLKQDFATRGIHDGADDLELVLTPGEVQVTNRLACHDFVAAHQAQVHGVLDVQDLVLRGTINTDNHSWNELSNKIAKDTLDLITDQWRQDLVAGVLEAAKTQGIEFQNVTIRGLPLIENGMLNPAIRHSQLESLGTLGRLSVAGDADLTDTVHVRNRRLGINTLDPEMALSLWDEEVTVVAGKLKQGHAFLGTARSQNFSLGVNRKPYLEIDAEGLITVKNLRIDRHRMGFAAQVPGYSGTRGDLVFNSDPNDGQPFAWVCLGAFRWQPLRAA
jgi:hypothetical protein